MRWTADELLQHMYALAGSHRAFRIRLLVIAVLVTGTLSVSLQALFGRALPWSFNNPFLRPTSESLACSQLVGANDTVVILKTGAAELQDKLPIHFNTTLLCYPNYLIFSDHEEDFEGHRIIDALEFVDPKIQASNVDFDLWRRLKSDGRAALRPDELSGPESETSSNFGKPRNPGWKLDKWKFLPIVNRTLYEYPNMKWYIFVESDTYIFWSTALAWINKLDYTQPYYMGAQMQIAEVQFAHGGSGFIVSQAAMRKVVDLFIANQPEWESFTDGHWAGDCVLGKAFVDSGVSMTWARPIIQGVKPAAIDYKEFNYQKRLWCYPTISYHHLTPTEVEDVWNIEQLWLSNISMFGTKDESDRSNIPGALILRHKDVFTYYILPRITNTNGTKTDWDNLSGDFEDALTAESFGPCRSICELDDSCVQYAFSSGRCTMSEDPRLGEKSEETQAGWILDRVEMFNRTMEACHDELWIA